MSKRARQVVLDHAKPRTPHPDSAAWCDSCSRTACGRRACPPGPRLMGVEADRLEMDYPDLFRDYHITAKDIRLL